MVLGVCERWIRALLHREWRGWLRIGVGIVGIGLLWLGFTGCGGSGGSSVGVLPLADPLDQTGSQGGGGFQIQLRLLEDQLGDPNDQTDRITAAQRQILQQAADRWMELIVGDVADVALTVPPGVCQAGGPGISQAVDDLVIDVAIVDLDGLGGVLAQAGPCAVRQGSLLPAYGIVQLDRLDVALLQEQGRLLPAVVHEYGHVLGFGSLWVLRQLIQGIEGQDPRYQGLQGNTAFRNVQIESGVTPIENQVPIENQGNPGNRDAHWRESVLGQELMTGSLNLGAIPLSIITAGAIADLGYRIDPAQVDEFRLELAPPEDSPNPIQAQLTALRDWEGSGPDQIWVVDPGGKRVQTLRLR